MDIFSNWEVKDIVNTMISWSAFLVSLCTLAWQWRCKHPRYEIRTDSDSPNLVFKYQLKPENLPIEYINKLGLHDDGIPTRSRAIVYIQVLNHSETPITITNAELKVISKDNTITLKSNHRVIGTNYFIGMIKNNNKYGPYTIDMAKEQLNLPIILPPYGVKYGYLIFPTNLENDFIGTLTLFSPIKNQTLEVTVTAYDTFIKNNPNYIVKTKQLK